LKLTKKNCTKTASTENVRGQSKAIAFAGKDPVSFKVGWGDERRKKKKKKKKKRSTKHMRSGTAWGG